MPLNTLPFPTSGGVPYYDNKDASQFLTMPIEQYIRNGSNLFVPVSTANPQPTSDAGVLAKLVEILAKQSADPATQTTLATILSKIITAPATEVKQDALLAKDFATQATLATMLTKAEFDAKVDITISALSDALRGASSKTLTDIATALASVATSANQTELQNIIGALNVVAVTDPASTTAVLIALIKGLMKQMQGDGTGSMPVTLSGSYVEIGGVSFAVSGGDTLRNTAANKPNADAAHAAIPFCYYYAIDTGTVEATDGTDWVVI